MVDVEKMFENGNRYQLPQPVKPVGINLPDSKQVLEASMRYVLSKLDKQLIWLPEYDDIADWLAHNNHKGLMLCGNTCRGRSLLVKYVLPVIVNEWVRYNENAENKRLKEEGKQPPEPIVIKVFTPEDLKPGMINNIRSPRSVIFIDDVGLETQPQPQPTGEVSKDIFPLLVKTAEQQGSLLVVSTSLGADEFLERYGELTIHRLKSLTKIVNCVGDDLFK